MSLYRRRRGRPIIDSVSGGSSPVSTTISFASGVPSGWTFTRASTATYRDVNGDWQIASSGAARLHYPQGEAVPWFWVEPSITNKMTDRNAVPTDTTGWTKGGDAASTFAAVADPGTLKADAGLDVICTGSIYRLDNSAGSTDAYVDSNATFGATTVHTVSAWVSGTGTLTRTGSGTPETLAFNTSGLTRKALQITPNATGDKFRILVAAGNVVYFILPQIELGSYIDENGGAVPTTPVITSAATASRSADRLYLDGIDGETWFSNDAGAYVLDCFITAYNPSASQYLAVISQNGNTSGTSWNQHAVRIDADKGYTRRTVVAQDAGAPLDVGSTSSHKPPLRRRYPLAYTWTSGQSTVLSPALYTTNTNTNGANPTGLNRLSIGCRQNGTGQVIGGFRSITFYNQARTVRQLIPDMIDADAVGKIGLGQSNEVGVFRSDDGNDNTGERAGLALMNSYYTTTENWLIQGGVNGCALLEEADTGSGYYIDDGGVEGQIDGYGSAWNYAEPLILGWKDAGADIVGVWWQQGGSGIGAGVTEARHKAALLNLIDKVWDTWSSEIPFQLQPIARRGDGTNSQATTNVYLDIANDNLTNIYLGAEVYDIDLTDTVHWVESDIGYQEATQRMVRAHMDYTGETVTGGVYGPWVTSVTRSGTTVTFVTQQEYNSDATGYTLSSDIRGFFYFDDGVMVFNGVTTGVTQAGNVFTMTLSGAPTGAETFAIAYSGMYSSGEVDTTKLPKDNSTNGLPLRRAAGSVPYTAADPIGLDMLRNDVVFHIDAAIYESYPGSGQTVANIIKTPADSSSQSAYDFWLGDDVNAEANDPGFSGTVGDADAEFTFDGGDGLKFKGTITSFLDALHKTTGGTPFWIAVDYQPASTSTGYLFSTRSTTSNRGVSFISSNPSTLTQTGDSGTVAANGSAALTSAKHVLIVSYNPSSGQTTFWRDTGTGTAVTHTFNTSTGAASITPTIGTRNFVGSYLPSGSVLSGIAMGNTALDNTGAAQIKAYFERIHDR